MPVKTLLLLLSFLSWSNAQTIFYPGGGWDPPPIPTGAIAIPNMWPNGFVWALTTGYLWLPQVGWTLDLKIGWTTDVASAGAAGQLPPPSIWLHSWMVFAIRPRTSPYVPPPVSLTPWGQMIQPEAVCWIDLGGPEAWSVTPQGYEALPGGIHPWVGPMPMPAGGVGFGSTWIQALVVHEGSAGTVAYTTNIVTI